MTHCAASNEGEVWPLRLGPVRLASVEDVGGLVIVHGGLLVLSFGHAEEWLGLRPDTEAPAKPQSLLSLTKNGKCQLS